MLRGWPLAPDGRIFASPNDHLILTYYSGRPVQSIAPVRREWLDRFASDLLIVEGLRYGIPGVTEVQEIARRQGRMMNEIEAESRALDAFQLATGLDLQTSGAFVVSPPRMPDKLDQALIRPCARGDPWAGDELREGHAARQRANPGQLAGYARCLLLLVLEPPLANRCWIELPRLPHPSSRVSSLERVCSARLPCEQGSSAAAHVNGSWFLCGHERLLRVRVPIWRVSCRWSSPA